MMRRISQFPVVFLFLLCGQGRVLRRQIGKSGIEKMLDTARKMALPIDVRQLMGELMR